MKAPTAVHTGGRESTMVYFPASSVRTCWSLVMVAFIILTPVVSGELTTFTITENSKSGITIANISNIAQQKFNLDGNNNNQLVYKRFFSMRFPQSFVYKSLWLDSVSGVISTSGTPLDREHICQRQLECKIKLSVLVMCSSCSTSQLPVEFNVLVIDVNDHMHAFDRISDLDTPTFAENSQPNHRIQLPSAKDLDTVPNSPVSYSVRPGSITSPPMPFKVAVDTTPTGDLQPYLTLNGILDFETRNEYNFTLQAEDKDGRMSFKVINVKITNINDNAPRFLPGARTFNFTENHDPSLVLTTLAVQDDDVQDSFTFNLSGEGHENFRITNSGELYLNGKLHYEDKSSYVITVTVTDQGGLTDTVIIRMFLIDTNDNDPVIYLEVPFHAYNVSEDEVTVRSVLYFLATDIDTGEGGRVTCDLTPGDLPFTLAYDMQSYTSVNTVAGVVDARGNTRSRYDRETTPSYNLEIVCKDHGQPRRSSKLEIVINITDVNDNPPKFSQSVYTVNVSESHELNNMFEILSASDTDFRSDTGYRFQVGSGDAAGFNLDEVTGELTLSRKLDYETKKSYNLAAIAFDRDNALFTDSAEIHVNVLDADDLLPVFTDKLYNMTLEENGNKSQVTLGQVKATDGDTSPYDQMLYYLEPSDSDSIDFAIDEHTGVITSTLVADRERKSAYKFRVGARGVVTPSNHALCSVLVLITDVNDNAPEFIFPRAPATPANGVTPPPDKSNTVYISPLIPIGSRIAQLKATDPDVNSTTSFAQVGLIVSGQQIAGQAREFVVDPFSGWVTTTVSFKGIQFARKTLHILAIDEDSPGLLRTSGTLFIVVDSAVPLPGAQPGKSDSVVPRRNLVILVAICMAFALVCGALLAAILVLRARRRRRNNNGADHGKPTNQLRDSATSNKYASAMVTSGPTTMKSTTSGVDPYSLAGYTNETMRYSTGKGEFDDSPATFYARGPPSRRVGRDEDEHITNSDSGHGSNDGDVEMVNSPRRLDLSPKSSDISIQFTEGLIPTYSSYADGDTVVVTDRKSRPSGPAPQHAPRSAPQHVPPHASGPSHPPQRAPNGDIYARPTRLRIASQV